MFCLFVCSLVESKSKQIRKGNKRARSKQLTTMLRCWCARNVHIIPSVMNRRYRRCPSLAHALKQKTNANNEACVFQGYLKMTILCPMSLQYLSLCACLLLTYPIQVCIFIDNVLLPTTRYRENLSPEYYHKYKLIIVSNSIKSYRKDVSMWCCKHSWRKSQCFILKDYWNRYHPMINQ